MKYPIFIFIFLISTIITSQNSEDYAFNYNYSMDITGMAIKDGFLYFGTYDTDKIYKIDLVESPYQTPIQVVTGISGVMDLTFNGNDLYIAQFNGGTIKKIDVSLSNPTLQTVVENVNAPATIEIYNNYLYIGEAYGYKISKIDLNETNPVPEDVVDYANGPWKIQIYNNQLYIAETYGWIISKFDLNNTSATKENLLTNIRYPYCIYINDNYLYFENNSGGIFKIFKMDLSETNTTQIDINVPNFWQNNTKSKFIVNNNILYRSYDNSIFKYDLNTLNIDSVKKQSNISFTPNPSSNYITFKNINQETDIKIINIFGQIITERVISEGENLNIENLKNGIYFIRPNDSYEVLKLIKQ